jgi:hypothetical protein
MPVAVAVAVAVLDVIRVLVVLYDYYIRSNQLSLTICDLCKSFEVAIDFFRFRFHQARKHQALGWDLEK